ncbi:MAG: hypothetical protein BJ554DRAFT_1405, partial [Olpidium bornovanus]
FFLPPPAFGLICTENAGRHIWYLGHFVPQLLEAVCKDLNFSLAGFDEFQEVRGGNVVVQVPVPCGGVGEVPAVPDILHVPVAQPLADRGGKLDLADGPVAGAVDAAEGGLALVVVVLDSGHQAGVEGDHVVVRPGLEVAARVEVQDPPAEPRRLDPELRRERRDRAVARADAHGAHVVPPAVDLHRPGLARHAPAGLEDRDPRVPGLAQEVRRAQPARPGPDDPDPRAAPVVVDRHFFWGVFLYA